MSEAPHAAPPQGDTQPLEHPEVAFETRDANVRTILITAGALAGTVLVSLLVVFAFFVYLERREDRAKEVSPVHWREVSGQLPPTPLLEVLQPNLDWLVVRTDEGERTFYVDTPILVLRDDKPASLFDIEEGGPVTVVYQPAEGRDRVISVESPGRGAITAEQAPGVRKYTATGRLVRVTPTNPTERREQALAEMKRYGWVDRKEGVAHIPIDQAMQVIVAQNQARAGAGKEGAGGQSRMKPGGQP